MTKKKVKRYLEFFDKKKDTWIRVQDDSYSEEATKIYDYIMAEIEINCLIEDLKQTKDEKGERD